ncbi:MAG TPA: tetratricopeptide repeat protein [Pyrinomonadaceae bacterium]|jgi:tetratricopeptide (TPR) repeat protein|nr:tetratricopeptide repeat protein [Pyrinomonadaceae bacterium]
MKKWLQLTFPITLVGTSLLLFTFSLSASVLAQTPTPTPTPAPRRPLPKPVAGPRGFDQYARREASARLIVGAATRGAQDPENRLFEDGEAAYQAGNYEKAVENFAAALKLKPDWTDAHYALALSLIETKNPQKALEEFKEVLRLKAQYKLMVFSNYNIGNIYLDLAEYEAAIDAYKYAIALKPELLEPHYNLGLAYAASDKVAEALAEFKEAAQLKPDFAEAHFNLAVAYLQSGKKREAEEEQTILAKLDAKLADKLKALIEQPGF